VRSALFWDITHSRLVILELIVPAFRDDIPVSSSMAKEYGADMFYRNVGAELPIYTE
jgi:hypothetical protein